MFMNLNKVCKKKIKNNSWNWKNFTNWNKFMNTKSSQIEKKKIMNTKMFRYFKEKSSQIWKSSKVWKDAREFEQSLRTWNKFAIFLKKLKKVHKNGKGKKEKGKRNIKIKKLRKLGPQKKRKPEKRNPVKSFYKLHKTAPKTSRSLIKQDGVSFVNRKCNLNGPAYFLHRCALEGVRHLQNNLYVMWRLKRRIGIA